MEVDLAHGLTSSDLVDGAWARRVSTSFLHGSSPRSQHLSATLEVHRNTPGTSEEFTMMGWYGGGMGAFMWLGMGLFWLILLGLIVWLVIRLLPGSSEPPTRTPGESAVEILDRRMANGEIDMGAWQAQRAALLAAQRDGK